MALEVVDEGFLCFIGHRSHKGPVLGEAGQTKINEASHLIHPQSDEATVRGSLCLHRYNSYTRDQAEQNCKDESQ
jgi:hypothetical protein